MKPDTILKLGDFQFARYEIPEKITFGGTQQLVTHELVGGTRIIDVMGRQDTPLEWSGLFMGENALDRAKYIDGLRVAGKPLALRWDDFYYQVVISSFSAEFERFYQIPYRISCLVLEDKTDPIKTIADPGIDDLIGDDMASAMALGDLIGDGPLSALLRALDTAIKAVSTFATAVQSTINSVLAPLSAVLSRIQILIASVTNVLQNVTTLGGVLPRNPISTQAAQLTQQVSAMTQLPQLYNLQSVLGRMGGNLQSIGVSENTITVAGDNLFKIASEQYGDATAWTGLARANKLLDPMLEGVKTLTIPNIADDNDGILNA